MDPPRQCMKRTPLQRNTPMRRTPSARRSNPKTSIPKGVRDAVNRRSGGVCEFVWVDGKRCEDRSEANHHRLMRSAGGKHTEENLLDVCNHHHRYIHGHPNLSYDQGWLIRRS